MIHGAEANDIIESTVVRDIPGAKLNAALLRDRVPIILMQAPLCLQRNSGGSTKKHSPAR